MPQINLDKPLYDQSTYWGRAKHFFLLTSPLNILATEAQLDEAKKIVDDYRQGKLTALSDDERINQIKLWRAKYLYDSAFHPATGEKMILIGRMSSQVPMNIIIIGGMLSMYNSTPGTIFWQWFNQSFNAMVNYTNRSGGSVDKTQLAAAYFGATGGALATALGLNKVATKFPPIYGKMVPFVAVALANCINIPLMRSHELKEGIAVYNDKDEKVGDSVPAAKKAISQVVVSRIIMASPGMVIPPFIISALESRWPALKRPLYNLPLQTLLCGFLLVFATPMCCALFPQRSSIAVGSLEPSLRDRLLKDGYKNEDHVFYNKGL